MALHQLDVREVSRPQGSAQSAQPRSRPQPATKAANRTLVRRRTIVLLLTALAGVALVAALSTGSGSAWGAFLAVVALGGAYLAGLHHLRRTATEREFAAFLDGGPDVLEPDGWTDFAFVRRTPDPDDQRLVTVAPAPPGRVRQAGALIRFFAADLAGWALSPVVFALTLILGETPADTTGQRWLAQLQTTQVRLRETSRHALAVSATTAGVTAAGIAVVGGAGVATAAPQVTASASVLAAPSGASGATTTYTVVPGDTLGSIAARYGTTVQSIVAANHITNPNLIFAGTRLTIQGAHLVATTSAPATHGGSYTVVAGDSLGSIAARYGTTVAALAAANHIANPNLIFAGQVLTLAGATTSPAPATTTAPTTTATTGGTYTVVAGDSLGSIAARYGTTVAALAAANHIANPNLIFAGEVLTLAGGHATTTTTTTASHPAPTPTPAPAASRGATAVHVAMEQLGRPYVWAGASPAGFDCSGLIMYAWAAAGVSLPHYTVSQYEVTTRISESQLQPGDLVFYDTGDGAEPGHVTIYIGGGQVITADNPGTVVKIVPLTWDGSPMGYGRVG